MPISMNASAIAIRGPGVTMVVGAPASAREAPMAAAFIPPENRDDERTIVLIRRAREGDNRARDVLFDRYRTRLERWATGRLPYSARDVMDTQDLVQEVLIAALNGLPKFNPIHDRAFTIYLRVILKRKIIDAARRATKRPQGVPLDEEVEDPGPTPIQEYLKGQVWADYEAAMNQLPLRQQWLIFLRLELGLGYQEIADVTGKKSADTARVATGRAVLNLSRVMRHDTT